jgi:hypothetical protein
VSTRAANGGPHVTRLQCRFCITFGREEKVGAKRQASTAVQGWMCPFRYGNIESHVSGHHPTKWVEYKRLNSIVERQAFFGDVPVVFRNSIKAHFSSSSLGAERQIVFDIEKDIVDVIMRGMMFGPSNIVDSDADSDVEENDPAFGSDTEHNVVLRRRIQKAALAKEQGLSLFQRMDQEEEEEEGNASYSYSVIIPKSKTIVFKLYV